jgi:hypothetical protein
VTCISTRGGDDLWIVRAIAKFLKQQGFAKLSRRADNELPETVGPIQADRADVQALSLEPRGELLSWESRLVHIELSNIE